MKSSKIMKEFRGHTAFVNDARFSADFNTVVTGGSDGAVKMWDVKTGTLIRSVRPPMPEVRWTFVVWYRWLPCLLLWCGYGLTCIVFCWLSPYRVLMFSVCRRLTSL